MYPLTSRRWFFPAILALALLLEAIVLRATWRTDTQTDAKLRKLQVRSGYELLLESPASNDAQPILSYNATHQHNHRLTVSIAKAKLSDESLRLLTVVNPPKTFGPLIYGPDTSEPKSSAAGCLMSLRVEFPLEETRHARSVAIAPPKSQDVFDRGSTRLVHLSSHWPLTVRVSANSPNGMSGPGCRNLLSIGSWQQAIGKDIELAFVVDPKSFVDLTLSSPSFRSGKDEVESLEIEPLLPYRLTTRPLGLSRVIQSRVYAGTPPLALTDLRLGGDFFDVELSGKAGVPVPEYLGWITWPLLALLDLPLLALAIKVFLLKKTVFISYSWADRERVMPIYERLKKAGLDVWIDREQLRSGTDWEQKIRAEMLKARRILIFLSHSLNDGGFLLTELGLARAIANERAKRGTFVIPIRLEDCPIPPILSQWNAVDLFQPDGEKRLFEDLGVSPLPSTEPAAPTLLVP
jgi:hypothetical protein